MRAVSVVLTTSDDTDTTVALQEGLSIVGKVLGCDHCLVACGQEIQSLLYHQSDLKRIEVYQRTHFSRYPVPNPFTGHKSHPFLHPHTSLSALKTKSPCPVFTFLRMVCNHLI